MKLLDQVFKLYPPVRWAEHLPIPMPPFWAEAAGDIQTDDLECINWNSGFMLVAKYVAEDAEVPFDFYREGTAPTSLRLTFAENCKYRDKKVFSPEYSDRTLRHSCGCCITLFYTEAK
jgi:hypothetical protein